MIAASKEQNVGEYGAITSVIHTFSTREETHGKAI